jgi:DNA-directed RNA polymerase subunit omega
MAILIAPGSALIGRSGRGVILIAQKLHKKVILNIDFSFAIDFFLREWEFLMRNDYLRAASAIIKEPNILINVVSKRVRQLKAGSKPLVDSLEKLDMEDIALKEIIEGKITYELFSDDFDGRSNT